MSIAAGFLFGTENQWTNQPAAVTEFVGIATRRRRVDLRGATLCRLVAHISVVGTAGSVLLVQYTTDLTGATGWTTLTNNLSMAALGTVGSTWAYIPSGAKTEVLTRIVGSGGDAVADPFIHLPELQVW